MIYTGINFFPNDRFQFVFPIRADLQQQVIALYKHMVWLQTAQLFISNTLCRNTQPALIWQERGKRIS